jgi:aminopeptidase-like protein
VAALEIVDALETNAAYLNRSPFGEPRLGKRGLYQSVPDGTYPEAPLLWVLSLSDGTHDLVSIAEQSGLPYRAIRDAAATLVEHDLLEPAQSPAAA